MPRGAVTPRLVSSTDLIAVSPAKLCWTRAICVPSAYFECSDMVCSDQHMPSAFHVSSVVHSSCRATEGAPQSEPYHSPGMPRVV